MLIAIQRILVEKVTRARQKELGRAVEERLQRCSRLSDAQCVSPVVHVLDDSVHETVGLKPVGICGGSNLEEVRISGRQVHVEL